MRPLLRTVFSALIVAGAAVTGASDSALAQSAEPAVVPVAVGAGSTRASIADVDARIARMVTARQLVRTYSAPDPVARNRRLEYFAQHHEGIPVLGGGISRQLLNGTTVSAFGTLYLGIDVPTGPRLAGDVAVRGLRDTAATAAVSGADVTLIVLPEFDSSYRLTYRTTFTDGKVRFVDAISGELVRIEDAFVKQRAVGTGEGAHGDIKKVGSSKVGSSYEAIDLFRPAQIQTRSTQDTATTFEQLFQRTGATARDSDNVWVNPAVVDAHTNMGLAYDYFHQRMGWQGLDGSNALIDQVVTDRATIEDNAFFAQPGSSASNVGLLAFGVSSAGYPMATLDIVGHEAMHGVTFFSLRRRTGAGLGSLLIQDGLGPTQATSAGQTFSCNSSFLRFSDGSTAPFVCSGGRYVLTSNPGGAVNEGFADVFGTAIEFAFQPAGSAALRADYHHGEDAAPGGAPTALAAGSGRSLAEPTALRIDPSGLARYPDHFDRRIRYTAYVRNNQVFLSSLSIIDGQFINISPDDGGVHYNATIFGHVFYRAIEGGTHRTSGRSVTGVGAANRELIEKVFFRAMNVLMPSQVRFETVAAVLRQSAVDLYGSASAAYRAIDESLLAAGL